MFQDFVIVSSISII